DPGIVLMELFAWLVEMVFYRINRIPDANFQTFLSLLNPPGWQMPEGMSLDQAIRNTITELRLPYRAVTAQDFEALVMNQLPLYLDQNKLQWEGKPLARVRCLPERNLDSGTSPPHKGHFSVVLLAKADPTDVASDPSQNNLDHVKQFLDTRR